MTGRKRKNKHCPNQTPCKLVILCMCVSTSVSHNSMVLLGKQIKVIPLRLKPS